MPEGELMTNDFLIIIIVNFKWIGLLVELSDRCMKEEVYSDICRIKVFKVTRSVLASILTLDFG